MDIKVAYGEKVKAIRKSQNISQEKLAELAELDRTYISDIENGKRNVSIETVYKIAKALDKPMVSFFEF
ncbi:helix-turn-helix domain-containing protein [Mongoliitalea lutea]|uniref:Transcriptional regulator n=1 Tax=Mongoliitalea lutea TaxID=849756 RepID=A0A8J3D265_9BACT|nr:helix-turn-helix transcriptional regulator [Mongoliitalea lutea]GHB51020.1 transcriptional regulator [Mongoliitalea lutea]